MLLVIRLSNLTLMNSALTFIRVFLEQFTLGKTPSEAATTAYSETLRKYHNFLVRGIFSVAMKTCPSRAGFVATVGNGADDAAVVERTKEFLVHFTTILDRLNAFYAEKKLDA